MVTSKEEYYNISEDGIHTIDLSDIVTITASDVSVFDNSIINNTMFSDDIVFTSADGEETKVLEELKNQRLQIAALTDILNEIVTQRNFDVDMDIQRRIEKKRFIEKLSKK